MRWKPEDAVARILDEAVDSTYQKGGANANITGSVMSKETVMNKLHALNSPKVLHEGIRKVVETIILHKASPYRYFSGYDYNVNNN